MMVMMTWKIMIKNQEHELQLTIVMLLIRPKVYENTGFDSRVENDDGDDDVLERIIIKIQECEIHSTYIVFVNRGSLCK